MHSRWWIWIIWVGLGLAGGWLAGSVPPADPGVLSPELAAMALADPAVLQDVLIQFDGVPDSAAWQVPDRADLRARLIRVLQQLAAASQSGALGWLQAQGAQNIQPLWINNRLACRVPGTLLAGLSRLPGILRIDPDPVCVLAAEPAAPAVAASRWNLDMIKAPELWAQGIAGQGVVVATMDTGADPYHSDIRGAWRGGGNSWYDPHAQHSLPFDSNGHGTQVLGLILGGSNSGAPVGVAPGAQWIAVKIFNDQGRATASAIHMGFQWLLDPDGNPDTDDAPDVVNNSWVLQEAQVSCQGEFETDFAMLRSAGIAVVFAAGNNGPFAGTGASPADHSLVFPVGAADQQSVIAPYSSRGPSACYTGPFPALVAPGTGLVTADLSFEGLFPTLTTVVTGTSFAAAMQSGALALLLSAFPGTPPDRLELSCRISGRDLGSPGPDYDYGYGLLNVLSAWHFLRLPPVPLNEPGDLNLDNMRNALDLCLLLNYLAGNQLPQQDPLWAGAGAADFNGDAAVDALDAISMAVWLAGSI